MRIAIASVQVPFITGGAEVLTEQLQYELQKRGHSVVLVTIPFKWYPYTTLMNSMIMGRMIDLTEVNGEKIDVVIAMKFPAYYLKHPNKVVWLMHQHRQAYELWGTKYSDICNWENSQEIRDIIVKSDCEYLGEATKVFTIANNVSNRLLANNKIVSTALYPPPKNIEKFKCEYTGNFIFYPSRIDEMKRQRVLVESARYLKSDVQILIAGGGNPKEIDFLNNLITEYGLADKVRLLGFISEEEKIDYYSRCLGVYFGAYDEDYGYITLESFFSSKPVIVHKDAGGPLEFVQDSVNGYILDANPVDLAEKIDGLAYNKARAEAMGKEGYRTVLERNINWDYIIYNLLNS